FKLAEQCFKLFGDRVDHWYTFNEPKVDFETASLNADGVAFYNHVIDSMLTHHITPYINLHHFDLPVALYDKYHGWESKHVVELFVKFAEQCFKLFGDRVDHWYTFNEPKVDFETASLNADGVAFYNHVIDSMLTHHITPYINLHHFDLPVALYDKYHGWESKHVVELFVKFAEQCFKLFGDRVDHWYTFNEPKVVVDGQYLYGWHIVFLEVNIRHPRLQTLWADIWSLNTEGVIVINTQTVNGISSDNCQFSWGRIP
ncbi:hypothetical protein WP50_19850, partial [Lactiplantibacillus plantarum]